MNKQLCVKCLKANKHFDQRLTQRTFARLQEFLTLWAKIDMNVDLSQRINNLNFSEDMLVHAHCYSATTHKSNLANAVKRYNEKKDVVNVSDEIATLTVTSPKHIAPEAMGDLQDERNYLIKICDTEMIEIVQQKVIVDQETVDMKELEATFNDLLSQKGIGHDYNFNYISRYIKKILQDTPDINVEIDFLNSPRKPTVVDSKAYIQNVICNKHFERNTVNDEENLVNVTKLIRNELTSLEKWTFDGDFTNFVHPPILLKMMRMIAGGIFADPDMNQKRSYEIFAIARTATEFLYSNFKSDRVVQYKPKSNTERGFENSRLSLISLNTIIPANTKIQRMHGQVVCVRDFLERLGEKRSKALLGWYTFQETDMTGGFAGKGITTHFKAFLAADDDILQAFIEFGETLTVSDFVIKQTERYICYLYARTFTQNICELRYSLSLQENKQGSQLPPKLGSLIPHVKRSFYMSLIWKTSIQSSPAVISPCDFGWYLDETGEYHPVRCDKPSASDALLELKHCGCKRIDGRCSTSICKCYKNRLTCTDLCKCGDLCKNRINDDEHTINHMDDVNHLDHL